MTTDTLVAEPPSLLRRAVALVAAFVTMNVAGAAIATAMSPLVRQAFGSLLRDPAREGLNLPALLGGYLVMTAVLAFLHRRLRVTSVQSGASLGLVLGLACFLGDHLVTAGWSTMPATAMAASGLLDSLSVAAAGAVISAVAPSDPSGA
jgi:hypothetical protein